MMHTRPLFVLLHSATALALLSCTSTVGEVRGREKDENIMNNSESNFLNRALGKYRGPNLLWFEDPKKPEESVSDVEVTETEINYTWSFRGKAQTGKMRFEPNGASVAVDWVDSWHAADGFKSVGSLTTDGLNFLCHYGPENEPQWGWRTELSMPNSDQLLVEMFNITPDSQEQIAVRIVADKK